jgi:phosphatidylglycerophosphate synthase
MGTYTDIKKLQQNAEIDDYINFYFFRRISVFFSVVFVKLKLSANFVTLLSLLSDFFVIYLMFLNHWIIAGVLVNLALILDSSDGEVARYYRSKMKRPPQTKYGGFLDETLGTIGFSLVIFFVGYFMGSLWLGFAAMFGLLMTMVTSLCARLEFPNQRKITKKIEENIFGKLKGRIGFNCAIQRLIVSIAAIFSSQIILLIFAILINLFWLMKYWIYRKY